MPRKTRRSSPSRPAPKQQHRKASTLHSRPAAPAPAPAPKAQPKQHSGVPATAPQQQNPATPPVAGQKGPGLLGQVAATAVGVGIGSTLSHGLTSLFSASGRSSEAEAPQEFQPQDTQPQTQYEQPQYQSFGNDGQTSGGVSCEADAKAFTKCLEQNNHNVNLCQWYLENLKACQQMASQY